MLRNLALGVLVLVMGAGALMNSYHCGYNDGAIDFAAVVVDRLNPDAILSLPYRPSGACSSMKALAKFIETFP